MQCVEPNKVLYAVISGRVYKLPCGYIEVTGAGGDLIKTGYEQFGKDHFQLLLTCFRAPLNHLLQKCSLRHGLSR